MWSCLPFFHSDLVELRFSRSPGDLAVRAKNQRFHISMTGPSTMPTSVDHSWLWSQREVNQGVYGLVGSPWSGQVEGWTLRAGGQC